jgi:hypothetical protein
MPLVKVSTLISFVTRPVDLGSAAAHAGGWSEQVWCPTPPFSRIQAVGFGTVRANLLPQLCTIVGLRQQIYTIAGNKLVPGGASVLPLNLPGASAYTINNPQSSLALRITSAGVANVGRYTLRAVPDEVMVNGEFNGDLIYKGRIDALAAAMIAYQTGFVGRNLAAVSASCLGSDGTSMIVANSGIFAVGDFVRFVKIKGSTSLPVSGTFQITAILPGNKITFVGGAGSNAKPGGTIRVDGIGYFTTAAVSIGRAGVRKVGRPFGGYVGRRSKRRVA